MARTQPKKYIQKVNLLDKNKGFQRRLSYQKTILNNASITPKPLEYDDIDKAMFEFVDKLDVIVNGKKIPTFTLYSNQRFSEYTQTWQYTNEEGNLYLNFKTVNRDKNPDFGSNQGEKWNIPGQRKYTYLIRDVLDDNGNESYEVHSVKQPFSVDLSYNVNFVTNSFEKINEFNLLVNRIFSERQGYIRPNGHYLPIVVDQISDETSYNIENRKFYVQTINLKVMAYIMEKDSFEVKRYPKTLNLIEEGDKFRKVVVDIEEYDNDSRQNKTMGLNIILQPYYTNTSFVMDCEMVVEEIMKENVRILRVSVNGNPYYIEKGFTLHEGDNVKIMVKALDLKEETKIKFIGYDPNVFFNENETEENVYDEPMRHEEIEVE